MNSLSIIINDLFLNHRQPLIYKICRIVGCPQTAEDLAHESYLKMLRAAENQDISHPQSYLYQIGRNLALDHLRKQKIRQCGNDAESDDESLIESTPSAQPSPEQRVIDQQQVELMLRALENLPERRRQILVLHKLHHWPYQRIAKHLGISRSTVEKNIYAALAQLLAEQGHNEH